MGWLKILCVQFGCGLGREVDLLDDLEVVSIEPDDFAGGAGEEADFLIIQVRAKFIQTSFQSSRHHTLPRKDHYHLLPKH